VEKTIKQEIDGIEVASIYLKETGIELIERNWECEAGNADLIIKEDNELVFVEVKTRRGATVAFPKETITAQKRARSERIALNYLATHNLASSKIRFDIISVILMGENKAMIRHHRDAFAAA
jgi:putative endonuclease